MQIQAIFNLELEPSLLLSYESPAPHLANIDKPVPSKPEGRKRGEGGGIVVVLAGREGGGPIPTT
jgi:hypothetical protein